MNRRSAIRNLLAACAGSFFLRGASAQDYTIRSDVRLVLLDVSVTDARGNPVSGLSKDSFRVFEDGRPQTITVFDHEDLPVTVGILVDDSGSMTPKRSQVLSAAELLIAESNPHDEVFIVHFNDSVTFGLPPKTLFSDDIKELKKALVRGTPMGKTALNDAIVTGLERLELGHRSRKTLVLISDGGDNASEHSRAETLAMVEKSLATIYTVGLYDAEDPDRDPALLKKLVRISGGQAFFPDSPQEMTPVCRRIAKDIRARYTVGYRPEEANGKNALRHVRVSVSAPGRGHLTVRTRESYRYEEAQT
ncbi:MAG TPA: VWA domain-containing protein [Bryobacteraceae bacterium]|nr:VWA domain-containing protein [Bryobacteraceae bacterium]